MAHVVVTGASSGIGVDLARAYAVAGNKVSLVARRKNLLEDLQKTLACEAQSIAADLCDPNDDRLARCEATFGPVDILINNAGMSFIEPTARVDAARIQQVFQLNVLTPIAAVQRVLPAMLARNSGAIVNVLSNAAYSPAPFFAHYTASKAALGNYSEALRMELRKTGVTVVSVYPGPIETPMGDRNLARYEKTPKIPTGDTKTLAKRVVRAVNKRSARLIYPRFYALAWWFPGIGRFVAERFVPAPRPT
jgi:short-subunit dehydrogenase